MAGMGSVDLKELRELQTKLNRISQNDAEKFCESCAKEIASRLLGQVIDKTQPGDYSDTYDLEDDGEKKNLVKSSKKGGTLRRGWTTSDIRNTGNAYEVEIINPVEYASYVEYGHRQTPGRYVPAIGKKLKSGWVEGKLIMTNSVKELQKDAPKIIEKKVQKFLEGSV
jgi:hypothetical protein